MNILQVHLELANKPPEGTTIFEGETKDFKINVENGGSPIQFKAKRQNYVFNKDWYSKMKLDPSEIVQTYRRENLHQGALKICEKDKSKYKQYLRQKNGGFYECQLDFCEKYRGICITF